MAETKPIDLEKYKKIIAEVVRDIGLNPDECYNEQGNYWTLLKGSAEVNIYLYTIDRPGEPPEWYIEFSSPVMQIPSTYLLAFYRRLLEENAQRIALKFALREDTVWVEITRELEGLSFDECRRNLTRIGETADELDDILKEEFQ
ncbi:MAG: YbjN domain-containing protein [Candidatus Coatesbacteria bacterium]|nr:MAG: YbjN domain-containing protein [Candidatus Coatesbacteria bacterium]